MGEIMKDFTLIIGGSYSISNDTDADPQSDYSPGIWAISSFAKAIAYAQGYINLGHNVRVTCYDTPNFFAKSNEAIKLLGLSQELYEEIKPLEQKAITADVPKTFAELKRYMVLGRKFRVINGLVMEKEKWETRETEVIKVQTNAIVSKRGESGKSWIEWDKASNWVLDNQGATYHYLDRDGKYQPSFRIEYI